MWREGHQLHVPNTGKWGSLESGEPQAHHSHAPAIWSDWGSWGPGGQGKGAWPWGSQQLRRYFLMPAWKAYLPLRRGETQGQGAFPLATRSQGWRLSSCLCPSFAPSGKVLPLVAYRSAPFPVSTHTSLPQGPSRPGTCSEP